MSHFLLFMSLAGLVLVFWLGWQLLRQNGRILLRLEDIERRLTEFEFGEPEEVSET